MRLVAATLFPYALPLTARWRSAAGGLRERRGLLFRLTDTAGHAGWGECAPLPSHGGETPAAAQRALACWARTLPGQETGAALEALGADEGSFRTPAARCAVECALLDLIARQAGQSLVHCLRRCDCAPSVRVNALAGSVPDVDAAALRPLLDAGFDVIKLKAGLAPPADEAARVNALARLLPPAARLRLDANRAWSAAGAAAFFAALDSAALSVIEAVEEPLADPEPAALAALQASLPCALALDESWPAFAPEALFGEPPVRRLVIKPAIAGGLLPALALAQRAAAAGLDCVVSTGLDSACGRLAATHLAAVLGNGLAHGLATGAWLARDTGATPPLAGGRAALPHGPGLGFSPDPQILAAALPHGAAAG